MNVALIGDSHSQLHFNDVESLLASNGHTVVASVSKPGWGVDDFMASSELGEALSAMPEGVVVALGGNNFNLTDSYKEELEDFIDTLEDAGVRKIVWLGPFAADPVAEAAVSERHEWTAEAQKDWLSREGVAWVDMRPLSEGLDWRDGVHFDSGSYSVMIDESSPGILLGLTLPRSVRRWSRNPWVWSVGLSLLVLGGYSIVRAR